MGAGPAREREQSSRQDSRDLYCSGGRSSVSETRCNGGAFRDRSSPASGPGHPSQMGGVRRRAKQCFATRLPHPCRLPFERPVLKGPGRASRPEPLSSDPRRHSRFKRLAEKKSAPAGSKMGSTEPPPLPPWFIVVRTRNGSATSERSCVGAFRDPFWQGCQKRERPGTA